MNHKWVSEIVISVARILSGGAIFFPQKVDLLVVALTTRQNYLNNLSNHPHIPNFLKNYSCSASGGGCTYNFPL